MRISKKRSASRKRDPHLKKEIAISQEEIRISKQEIRISKQEIHIS